MAETVKILGANVALTATGNAIGNATVVRVSLIAGTNVAITRQYANGTSIGSVVLGTSDSAINLIKSPTDLIAANASNLAIATPISYS